MDLDVKMKAVVLGACFLIVSTLAGHFLYELYLVEDSSGEWGPDLVLHTFMEN